MQIKVSEIKSFISLKIFSKEIFIFSKIKVYADSGNSVTFGLITILDGDGV